MNYKQQVTAMELVAALATRTGDITSYKEFGPDPVVYVGQPDSGGGGNTGGSILILNQRDGESQGWQTIIPGQAQTVSTTGVAKILVECIGIPTDLPATGGFTLTAPIGAGTVITIGTSTFTEGVDWVGVALTSEQARDNLIAAILLDAPTVALLNVTPLGQNGIYLEAKAVGPAANTIVTTSDDASVVAVGATMQFGQLAENGIFMPPAKLVHCIGECARRGLKVELWYASIGNAPIWQNVGSSTLMASFENDQYWPLQNRV